MKVSIGIRLVGDQQQARLLLAGNEVPPNQVIPVQASELADALRWHMLQGWRIHERFGQTAKPVDEADAHEGNG